MVEEEKLDFDKQVECPICKQMETLYLVHKYGWCLWCNIKKEKERELKDLQKEVIAKGESSNEEYIICPYCGDNCSTDDLYESTDVYCDECGKEFHLEIEFDPKYSTWKIENKESIE